MTILDEIWQRERVAYRKRKIPHVGIGMVDPDFSFCFVLGVIKDMHVMVRICLCIEIIYQIPGKDRYGLSIPLVDNSYRRSSNFLGNGAILFQVWCWIKQTYFLFQRVVIFVSFNISLSVCWMHTCGVLVFTCCTLIPSYIVRTHLLSLNTLILGRCS